MGYEARSLLDELQAKLIAEVLQGLEEIDGITPKVQEDMSQAYVEASQQHGEKQLGFKPPDPHMRVTNDAIGPRARWEDDAGQ